MGLGLNLARVGRDSEEAPAGGQPLNRPVPAMNLGMLNKQLGSDAGALSTQTGASKIPALRLGDVGQAPEG